MSAIPPFALPTVRPYSLTLTVTAAGPWRALLFRGTVAVAKVTCVPNGDLLSGIDVRFAVAEHEAAFLTWVYGLKIHPNNRNAEDVVGMMLDEARCALTGARDRVNDTADLNAEYGMSVLFSLE